MRSREQQRQFDAKNHPPNLKSTIAHLKKIVYKRPPKGLAYGDRNTSSRYYCNHIGEDEGKTEFHGKIFRWKKECWDCPWFEDLRESE